ncbi:tRNA (adenosine(37)-N6)-threonylcarbamoyltransferase complex dimerization subunit type 1 TsaB [Pseudothauera nasutitermitis]|uniref:tRNA (Adenosine(37)-N6)-threonylcarbamoyltransferase complex dimerization subunit type 1 TsaB n=1 Tax=Pseudothauera nasutitermitis TaxID=2565930 RepID=A0A4S4B0P1_9RHOO|nr:tRNA (adenosine(37)-N6)-threonylcarbamoyltransferase complex dimerization subunit type 1 TsaB [Pseudothauera nasutitermitis]THF66101.1 tRNA (adenosine(37)-N6)-threonylcarbamoyltransferase complex dimerization subunit type 1 TsaB [Pseudothauera nasutitermitis]
MNILALETSCEHGSIALQLGDTLLQRPLQGHANHSAHLLPAVRELLAEAGITLRQLDAVAFGSGPGAFTGLRLSCAVAQGLALGADLGVAPVCSLEALALQGEGEHLLTATDARMSEVYYAAYRRTGDALEEVHPPRCAPPETLEIPAGRWSVLGSALNAYPALRERLAPCAVRFDHEAVPRAAEVARLGAALARRGALLAAELAAPLYVRDKVALTTAERLARGGRA